MLEHRSQIPRLALMPFGAGPRVCVGSHLAMTEGMLVLASIASRFSWQLKPDYQVEAQLAVTFRPQNGLPMYLQTPS